MINMKNLIHDQNIRDAQVEDAPQIAAAERKIAKVPGRLASKPHELLDDSFRQKIANLSASDRGKFIVFEFEGRIVAHASLEPLILEVTSHVVDLRIAVHEGYQGKGVGKLLLEYLINWAKLNPKIEKIMLNVRSSNQSAIALYYKLGFVNEGARIKHIKLGPNTYLDNIAMGLWVGP